MRFSLDSSLFIRISSSFEGGGGGELLWRNREKRIFLVHESFFLEQGKYAPISFHDYFSNFDSDAYIYIDSVYVLE